MLRRSHRRIVNVSSVAGLIAYPTTGSYSCSKHAIEAWTDILRRELAQFGVNVSLIEPGRSYCSVTCLLFALNLLSALFVVCSVT